MKRSYIIILVLALVFALGVTGLGLYARNTGILVSEGNNEALEEKNQDIDNADAGDGDIDGDNIGADSEAAKSEIVPFTSIVEKDGVLYTSRSAAQTENIEGAEIIPINSECFAIIGEDVYYITPGDEKFAPELRRCGVDGNNDVSITEFVSPLGAPAYMNDAIYSAYYTEIDGGMNNGIYRYDIASGETRKAIEGEFFIYGYDEDYIYYSTNESTGSGTELYRMDYEGESPTKVLSFSVRTDSIVVDKNYIFFSAFEERTQSYRLYRSPKDGKGNIDQYAFQCMSDKFDVIDGRIYYQADRSIYCSQTSGADETKIADLDDGARYAFGFLRRGGSLFFSEQFESDVRHFRYDEDTCEKKEITK